jgi:Metallopeptidase toxin 2
VSPLNNIASSYGNYNNFPVVTGSNGNNTINNGWGEPVVTLKFLLALIAELKATSIRRYNYAYVDSKGITHIGEMYEIENPNVPAQHMFYFDEIGGTTDLLRMTERPTGREIHSNSGSSANPPLSVLTWDGKTPQNTTNPNSVWIQDPNDGKWLFITPGGQTTTVGAPPVTAVPLVEFYDDTSSSNAANPFVAGKNNVFDATGKPLRAGDSGNLLQIEIGGVLKKPSELDNSLASMQTLLKIVTFYAKQKGYIGRTSIINLVGDKGGADVAFFESSTKILTVRRLSFSNKIFDDNLYDFRCVLAHEIAHSRDPKTGTKDYKFIDHADIYLQEAKDPDFKNASLSYKINNANQYMLRVFNAQRVWELGSNFDRLYMAIDNYNDSVKGNSGGVTIGYPSFTNDIALRTFDVSVYGILYSNSYKYEELKKTND